MAKLSHYALACAVALLVSTGTASAQDVQQQTRELKKQNTVPLSPDGSMPDKNATQEPSAKVRGTQGAEVLQNGSLTTNNAPTNSDTVPSLFSPTNAADDKLPIAAHTLKYLTDSDRRSIGLDIEQQVKASPDTADGAQIVSTAVGSEISTDATLSRLRQLPPSIIVRMPAMKGVGYIAVPDSFVLVDADNRMIIGTVAR